MVDPSGVEPLSEATFQSSGTSPATCDPVAGVAGLSPAVNAWWSSLARSRRLPLGRCKPGLRSSRFGYFLIERPVVVVPPGTGTRPRGPRHRRSCCCWQLCFSPALRCGSTSCDANFQSITPSKPGRAHVAMSKNDLSSLPRKRSGGTPGGHSSSQKGLTLWRIRDSVLIPKGCVERLTEWKCLGVPPLSG